MPARRVWWQKPADEHCDEGRIPGDEDGDQGDIYKGSVGQPLDVEQPVPAERDGDPYDEWQRGQTPDRAGGQ
jgi:hypothetical protein